MFPDEDGYIYGQEPSGFYLEPGQLMVVVSFLTAIVGLAVVCLQLWRELRKRKETEAKAPVYIFQQVNVPLEAALRSSGLAIIPAAQLLVAAIDHYLASVLALGKGLEEASDPLRDALKGKAKKKHKARNAVIAANGATAVIITTGRRAGGGSASAAAAGGSASASVASGGSAIDVVTPVHILPITTHGDDHCDASHGEGHGHGDDHGGDHGHDHGHEQDGEACGMTGREQALAVRAALEDFAEYWQRDRIESALRCAQQALLYPPKSATLDELKNKASHGKAGH